MNFEYLPPVVPCASTQEMAMMDPKVQIGKLKSTFNTAPIVDSQPKRPLSAYNIFFQVERQRLINEKPVEGPYTRAEVYSINLDKATRIEKSKRPHRKMHGMISFTDLAKTIAQKWKGLDAQQKRLFEERADDEKRKYAVELEEWLLRQAPTQQVKKRLSALRRGSLSKYISGRDDAPSPTPTTASPVCYSDNSLQCASQAHTPARSVVSSSTPHATPGNRSFSPQQPGRREIQLQRARNLQRLYQMQIELYNEQIRLHAECNADLASFEHEHFHHQSETSLEMPGVRLHEAPHFVSSNNLWDQAGDTYTSPYIYQRRYHGLSCEPRVPVKSPFHDVGDGLVSPFVENDAFD